MAVRPSLVIAAAVVATLATGAACDTYNPPPEVTLVQPKAGRWTRETPLTLQFTEAIRADTLSVTVWPKDVDQEGNRRPGVQPIVDHCTLATSPCGTFTMALDDTTNTVTMTTNGTFDDDEGVPLVLEIAAGLEDLSGRARKVTTEFDFQVSPLCGADPVDLNLQSGVISLTANLQVLPVWLHMMMDLAVDPDTGKTVVVATFARVHTGLAANYNHPDGFEAALDDQGWAVTFSACIVDRGDGTFFLQSEPFDISITVLSIIPMTLNGFQVQGTIDPGGASDGRDFASGTLSTTNGTFGDPPNAVDAITTAWDGFGFEPAELPEGLPKVCVGADGDACGVLDDAGGDCQLPTPWEPGPVCPVEE
ncbi:MAG: hypothetical protein KC635_12265 [Myxococcales bacterium]|nr:hypothetical protein [Myxococcales bacterium]MCB9733397.1 hypothetical protein [Deltaproteobacteria bacterium]